MVIKGDNGNTIDCNGTDDYGFTALPGGYLDDKGYFGSAGMMAVWWTSSEESGGGKAYELLITAYPDYVVLTGDKKSFGMSVRCVGG